MFLFILTFLIIFGPLVDIGVGQITDVIFGISLLLISYVLVVKKRKVIYEVKKYIFIILIILAYSALTTLLFSLNNPEASFRFLMRPVRIIITFLGIYSLVLLYIKKYPNNYMEKILLNVYYTIALHGAIMVYQYINPDFRNFIYSFTYAKKTLQHYQQFRMAGLAGGGGSMISTFEGMGIIILPFALKVERDKIKKFIIIILGIIIIYSIILSGRSGLVEVFIFMPIVGFYIFKKQYKAVHKIRTIIYYLAAFILMISTFVWTSQNISQDSDQYFQIAFDRTFESYNSYQETGEVSDSTVMTLIDMLILPENPIQFLFGEPRYVTGYRGVNSDIGYIRYIYGYGIFGSLLAYLFYIYAMVFLYKNRKTFEYWSFLTTLLLFVIMFFQFKEIFVFTKTGFSITSIMLIAFILYVKKQNIRLDKALVKSDK